MVCLQDESIFLFVVEIIPNEKEEKYSAIESISNHLRRDYYDPSFKHGRRNKVEGFIQRNRYKLGRVVLFIDYFASDYYGCPTTIHFKIE